MERQIRLVEVNAHITCRICHGYFIDATTITECLHTFCKSCIVRYLEEHNTCPTCGIVIHQSHPLHYIGHDRTMQDIVYKLVPKLQMDEEYREKRFYELQGMQYPHNDSETETEEQPRDNASTSKTDDDNDYHRSDEQVNVCLECNSFNLRALKRKYIRCSSQATITHIKKFIAKKLKLATHLEVDILCNEEILGKDHTLKFVTVTRWRCRESPLMLQYRPRVEL
ncbi:polycomb group RING finger protein 3-like [Saccoglossus kowalevskii]|uniref:Polycomb group RING finger protein 3-like n=1 Tax=Saccoglossus kowalevskii TaxID=10224 RepID=A0ABM0M6B8_SACKO|nr:PREDICTED: polycomb group RING finger protein 3-like [Saccoglossus kowalevskii]